MSQSKPFALSRQAVWSAYKKVKAYKGSAGIDGQSIEEFDKNLVGNLYKIWNNAESILLKAGERDEQGNIHPLASQYRNSLWLPAEKADAGWYVKLSFSKNTGETSKWKPASGMKNIAVNEGDKLNPQACVEIVSEGKNIKLNLTGLDTKNRFYWASSFASAFNGSQAS